MSDVTETFSEKKLIARVLKESDGNVSKAAKQLDIDPMWVGRKVTEHGLEDLART